MRESSEGATGPEEVPSEYFADEQVKEKQRLTRARLAVEDFWLRVWRCRHHYGERLRSAGEAGGMNYEYIEAIFAVWWNKADIFPSQWRLTFFFH